ncbi:hypothetical protein CH371_15260 [Leptospira wolffii]|uniref:YdhG-like domain-containing protein n=1 Tax=Leptospira wolffii TaxID=409998 RepID=A0A2M9Z8W3_9LEPT|nr:DUF1801 domain-containing protein [Leptospira wolffii]PJZ64866.1 hypothetical protein CH371_15260 [Leptospira wolffii]
MLLHALVPTLPRLDLEINSDVENYIENTPLSRMEKVRELVDYLRDEFSDLRESLKYRMPTFERNGKWVALSNHKNHLSVYFYEESFIRAFRAKYPGMETGKTFVHIKDKDRFPGTYLKSILKKALQ